MKDPALLYRVSVSCGLDENSAALLGRPGWVVVFGKSSEPKSSFMRFDFDGALTEAMAMDWTRIEGNWKQMKGTIKEQWGELTDDDLDQIAGKRDQLEGKIQERYGYEKDRARSDIDDWYNRQSW